MTSYLTPIDIFSLSRTVFEIFDFKGFRVWPWPSTFRGQLRSNICSPFESPYMTSYLTSIDTFSLSRNVFEIFDFKVFRVWPWPLTFGVTLGQKNVHHSKAHICLPILLLLALSLYLVPFLRYSVSKFLGFDLDLWPLGVTWGQKYFHYSKAHICLPILLLLALSLYLVPFCRYSTSKFLGFDLDLWPLGVTWGQKYFHHSKTHICLPISLLLARSLYLVPFSEIFDFKIFRVWPGPLTFRGHLRSNIFSPFESPYMTSYLTPIDTFSLSRTVFEIFDFKIFRVWPWPLNFRGHLRSNIFSPFESPYMTSYLTPIDTFSLYRTVFERFDIKVFRVWPWPLTFRGHPRSKIFQLFERSYMTSY